MGGSGEEAEGGLARPDELKLVVKTNSSSPIRVFQVKFASGSALLRLLPRLHIRLSLVVTKRFRAGVHPFGTASAGRLCRVAPLWFNSVP
jgi:hypothetical protein